MIQHYVPRVYLKNFAEKKGKDYFVDVFDKTTNKFFNTNIKNICAEKDLYTLDENSKIAADKYTVEKVYSQGLEPIYNYAYKIITNDRIIRITDIQRVYIIIGMLQFYTRNPRFLRNAESIHRKNIKKQCESAKNKGIKGITYLNEDFSFSEWDEDKIIEYIVSQVKTQFKERHLLGTKEVGEYHEFSKFKVFKTIDDSQFITSDNPLLIDDLVTNDNNPLLKSKEFTIPINPNYTLKIIHDNTLELNVINRLPIPNGGVGLFNSNIYDESSRFLIGNRKSIEGYFEINKLLSSTSLETKIDIMRQIVTKIHPTLENVEAHKTIKHYLDKYETEGNLSNADQYEMLNKIKYFGAIIKQNKIKNK